MTVGADRPTRPARAAASGLRVVLVVAGNDLRRKLRDRTGLLMGVVTPLVMAAVIGFAFGGGVSFSATIAVVDADGSALSAGLVEGLVEGFPPDVPVQLRAAEGLDAARAELEAGTVDAVLVVPSGFGAAVEAGGARPIPALEVVTDAQKRIAGDVAASIADGISARLAASTLAVTTAIDAGGSDPAQLVADAGSVSLPVALVPVDVGASYQPVAYFAAAMGILFLFFTVGGAARSLISERREGTLLRVRAAPVADAAVLVGKALAVLVVGLASLVTIWLVTTVVFRASWGDPAAVLALIVAVVLAVAGVATLVAGLARTDAQADGLTSMIAFLFALLGGSFFQPGALPPVLGALALATPNGWALRGLTAVGAGRASLADVAPNVAVLVAIGLVTGWIGVRAVRAKVLR